MYVLHECYRQRLNFSILDLVDVIPFRRMQAMSAVWNDCITIPVELSFGRVACDKLDVLFFHELGNTCDRDRSRGFEPVASLSLPGCKQPLRAQYKSIDANDMRLVAQ